MPEKLTYPSLNSYLRKRFGTKVYKVSLNAGFTCPNRDGKVGTGGCIFCSEGGSGEFARSGTDIKEQLAEGKAFIASKLPKEEKPAYIAYFQAFTNTYGPIDVMREKYFEAINDPEVVCLSIATRPDCIPQEVLELLKELNEIKPVWVELGLQTIHESTAEYIRRGYGLSVYADAVKRLSASGMEVITHVILGLPGESEDDMLETVKYVGESGAKGIKLQLLHVLKGTDLAKEYAAGKFKTLTRSEYINLLCKCIKVLPKDMIIHRLTGDGDKKLLIAPEWSADKKSVLNEISKYLSPT
ncbi:MAG: TIGR01212 family radical SAM protein [Lachnospiraceae bacterium]|nr:TIGR01212 family radical SAM protein [Lachnospiraceae bacterium]